MRFEFAWMGVPETGDPIVQRTWAKLGVKADGVVVEAVDAGGRQQVFSTQLFCRGSGRSFEELDPRLFSFNSPQGACAECSGLGYTREVDPEDAVLGSTVEQVVLRAACPVASVNRPDKVS